MGRVVRQNGQVQLVVPGTPPITRSLWQRCVDFVHEPPLISIGLPLGIVGSFLMLYYVISRATTYSVHAHTAEPVATLIGWHHKYTTVDSNNVPEPEWDFDYSSHSEPEPYRRPPYVDSPIIDLFVASLIEHPPKWRPMLKEYYLNIFTAELKGEPHTSVIKWMCANGECTPTWLYDDLVEWANAMPIYSNKSN